MYKIISKPQVVWGNSDFPESKRADYYIKVNNRHPIDGVKLYLKPKSLQPTDYKVRVTEFFQLLGREHLQEIECLEENLKWHKEVTFDLPKNGLFRLIIESNGGTGRTLLPDNLEELKIKHPDAKIYNKPRKFPKL
ncbi:MAG: hypothetical protein WCS92_05250 [Candidatus Babeliales bacterium]